MIKVHSHVRPRRSREGGHSAWSYYAVTGTVIVPSGVTGYN